MYRKKTEKRAPYSEICKPFEEARAFARDLGLKNIEQWLDYCKSGKKPNDIPHKPDRIYKNKGWKSYGDWLGTWKEKESAVNGYVEQVKYLPFEDAKKYVARLRLKNVKEWFNYCDGGKRPKNIPYNPDRAYKNSGWKSYADWLGFMPSPPDFNEEPTFEKPKTKHSDKSLEAGRKRAPVASTEPFAFFRNKKR